MKSGAKNHSLKADATRKRLRETMSISERVFWELIRKDQIGYRFRRQVSIGNYYIDFYCASAQLGIEIDGEQHQDSKATDAYRDKALAANGVEILRIPSLDLFDGSNTKISAWIELVRKRCAERTAQFDSLRQTLRGGNPR